MGRKIGGRLKWRGFHGNHETGHVQKAKLENRYTHTFIHQQYEDGQNTRAKGP